jgi:shikimate kinase
LKAIHLYLTGYRGCGKSTLSKLLGSRLSRPIVDTDELIESKAGVTIASIFDSVGEDGFRDLESVVISEVSERSEPHVIALGGGAILRDTNRELIRQSGWVAWLRASPSTLAMRIAKDATTNARRPPLSKLGVVEEIETVLARRTPLYQAVAHASFSSDTVELEQLADEVFRSYVQWQSTGD